MNTDQYFHALKYFMRQRSKINEDYIKALQRLQSARGSAFFEREKTKLDERRESQIEKEKSDAARSLRTALARMRSRLKARKLHPLTDEQVRVLQTLRMMEHVSEYDLDAAAQNMESNEQGLELLGELRKKHGYHGSYRHKMKRFPTGQAYEVLATMESSANRILQSSAAPAAAMAQKYHIEMYGGEPYDEMMVRQEEPFFDKSDCLRRTGFLWGGTPQPAIDQFCNAVD